MDMHGGGFSAGDTTAAQHVRLAGGGTAAAVALSLILGYAASAIFRRR